MKKVLVIMFVLMFSPCLLFGQDVVVVLLKTEGCAPCVELEKVISNPTVQSTIAQNKVLFRAYEGEKWPKYLARHRVTSFPTTLKFERDKQGKWVEVGRIVGLRQLNFLLDFLGKRSIIKRVKEIPRKVILGGS
jgi:hypothetical protein